MCAALPCIKCLKAYKTTPDLLGAEHDWKPGEHGHRHWFIYTNAPLQRWQWLFVSSNPMTAGDTVEDRKWVIIWGQHVLILYALDASQAFYVWILNSSVPVLWRNSLGMNMSLREKKKKRKDSFKTSWWSLKWHDKVMTASEEMLGGNERERLHLSFSCVADDWIILGNEWTFMLTYTVSVQRQDESKEGWLYFDGQDMNWILTDRPKSKNKAHNMTLELAR